jgi:ABC-type phosphate/phosphonate transport system ATPase subunit
MAHVCLNQVSKSYDGHLWAVKPLDLEFEQGQMLALLGRMTPASVQGSLVDEVDVISNTLSVASQWAR